MSAAAYWGWDIGGAHLKAAVVDTDGKVIDVYQVACPLWQGIEHLDAALSEIRQRSPHRATSHAITMTGELCDNFASRIDGVTRILEAFARFADTATIAVYAGQQRWVTPTSVDEDAAASIASANWMATAEYVARKLESAIVVDIGSTTTDVVPISGHTVDAVGVDDASRLRCGELIYTGIARTPLMAVSSSAPYAGADIPLAAEHFATMADVYRLIGDLDEAVDHYPAADNGEKSRSGSARRLFRMLGLDFDDDFRAAELIANHFAHCQFTDLYHALIRVMSRRTDRQPAIVATGIGAFLAHRIANHATLECCDFFSLFESDPKLQPWIQACAPAVAVASLHISVTS